MAVLAFPLACATLNAQLSGDGYKTPAYIDFERGEWAVSEADAEVEVVVQRTGEFRESFTLHYQTVEDTATEGRDYKGTGGTLIFQPMETFKTIKIGILPDDTEEGDERFGIRLSSDEPKAFFVREVAIITIGAGLPVLNVRPGASGTVVLSWAKSVDYVLERASDLSAGDWQPVPCELLETESGFEVQERCSGSLSVYRLRRK